MNIRDMVINMSSRIMNEDADYTEFSVYNGRCVKMFGLGFSTIRCNIIYKPHDNEPIIAKGNQHDGVLAIY